MSKRIMIVIYCSLAILTSCARSTGTESPLTDCKIKGNISSKGEKIYHTPGCNSYDKTVISTSVGEKWFCTEQDARDAGWRKAQNCK